ncbi:hypothetical protein AJ88_26200 [Mesorhizobium amorphae CCBAU 01583]|nr:hypothetical protein AJ88_26200 [Mesorhizobium amorphae CCBAU 01583]
MRSGGASPWSVDMAERNNLASMMHVMATSLERTPLDAKIDVVETACLKRGILVTADQFVRQADAAALLGISPTRSETSASMVAWQSRVGETARSSSMQSRASLRLCCPRKPQLAVLRHTGAN